MPFPLAHPAAVLPVRRFCPRFLSFPALVAGSVSPDAGYLLSTGVEDVSHRLVGGLGFGLVTGLIMLFVFYFLCPPLMTFLPAGWRQMLSPFWRQPLGSPGIVVLS